MKKIFLLLSLFSASIFAQNLVSTSNWVENATGATGFIKLGTTGENIIVSTQLPNNTTGLVWKAQDADSSPSTSSDGGFHCKGGTNSDTITVDVTKTYRYSVWVKQYFNTSASKVYFGPQKQKGTNDPSETNLWPITGLYSGASTSNPYFFTGTLPQNDKWYLLVGYVYAKETPNSTLVNSSIYDGSTMQKVAISGSTLADFRFPNNNDTRQVPITKTMLRAFLYGVNTEANTGDNIYLYDPRIEQINGNETTIEQLLGMNVVYGQKMAIGTSNYLGDYELAVNGEIIAKEVNVNLNGPWPDYVFENDYNLKSIEEVEAYIKSNKHLPEVPSAEEVCKEGIFLGDMNAKLLKKIEELTLYVIEQNKQIKTLQVEVEELKKK